MRWRSCHQIIMCIVYHRLIVIFWMLFLGGESLNFTSNIQRSISTTTNLPFVENDKISPVSSTYFHGEISTSENISLHDIFDKKESEEVQVKEYKHSNHSSLVNSTNIDASQLMNIRLTFQNEELVKKNNSDTEISAVNKNVSRNDSEIFIIPASINFAGENITKQAEMYLPNKFHNNDTDMLTNKAELSSLPEIYQRLKLTTASMQSSNMNATFKKHSLPLSERSDGSDGYSSNSSNGEEISEEVPLMKKKDDPVKGTLNTVSGLEEMYEQKVETQMPDYPPKAIAENSSLIQSSVASATNHSVISSTDTFLHMDNSSADNDSYNNSSFSGEESTKILISSAITDVSTAFTTEMLSVVVINGTTDPTVESLTKEDILGIGAIIGIIFGVLGVVVLVGGVFGYLIYHRRFRPLSDIKYPTDNCAYVDDSLRVSYINNHIELPKDNSEEMFSLDNDSFLNSLEAMTLQNYWAEDAKNTKV